MLGVVFALVAVPAACVFRFSVGLVAAVAAVAGVAGGLAAFVAVGARGGRWPRWACRRFGWRRFGWRRLAAGHLRHVRFRDAGVGASNGRLGLGQVVLVFVLAYR